VVWSACGKVLCLWSVFSGTFLGKIGHDKELEDTGAGGWEEPPPRASVAEDIAKLRIHSCKVRSSPRPAISESPVVSLTTPFVHTIPNLNPKPSHALLLKADIVETHDARTTMMMVMSDIYEPKISKIESM
jgi:hypothetical protein